MKNRRGSVLITAIIMGVIVMGLLVISVTGTINDATIVDGQRDIVASMSAAQASVDIALNNLSISNSSANLGFGDWDVDTDDANGNGRPDFDEVDDAAPRRLGNAMIMSYLDPNPTTIGNKDYYHVYAMAKYNEEISVFDALVDIEIILPTPDEPEGWDAEPGMLLNGDLDMGGNFGLSGTHGAAFNNGDATISGSVTVSVGVASTGSVDNSVLNEDQIQEGMDPFSIPAIDMDLLYEKRKDDIDFILKDDGTVWTPDGTLLYDPDGIYGYAPVEDDDSGIYLAVNNLPTGIWTANDEMFDSAWLNTDMYLGSYFQPDVYGAEYANWNTTGTFNDNVNLFSNLEIANAYLFMSDGTAWNTAGNVVFFPKGDIQVLSYSKTLFSGIIVNGNGNGNDTSYKGYSFDGTSWSLKLNDIVNDNSTVWCETDLKMTGGGNTRIDSGTWFVEGNIEATSTPSVGKPATWPYFFVSGKDIKLGGGFDLGTDDSDLLNRGFVMAHGNARLRGNSSIVGSVIVEYADVEGGILGKGAGTSIGRGTADIIYHGGLATSDFTVINSPNSVIIRNINYESLRRIR